MTTALEPAQRPYTLIEALDRLGIGETLGRQLARDGKLPGCFKLGGRYLVARPVVDRLVETGEMDEVTA